MVKKQPVSIQREKAFELSADWIACALDEGMLEEEILAILMTEINIAKAIILKGKNQFRV